MSSFEVCPSKIRVTRRLTYIQLDEMLAREEGNGRMVESVLGGGSRSGESVGESEGDDSGSSSNASGGGSGDYF